MASLDFSSYDDLQKVVATYLQRANLTAQIPLFIQLAEVRLRNIIRTLPQQVQLPYTLVPGQGSQIVALPSDYGAMIRVTYNSIPMTYITPDQLQLEKANDYLYEYTIIGTNILLQTYIDGSSALTMYYYQELQGLSDSNESNWLLEDYPNLYLYATLLEATPYLIDDERIEVWEGMLQEGVTEVQMAAKKEMTPERTKLTIKRS
ncbi:phage adaptor protein [Burkholderia multivorans]|uniref:phage adaptor protein n=1 Tax=Burkholderia multivorans TaxID=87883 RepID=UPI0011B24A20|nr:hypothetical protein [Burkholderia multivorans]